MKPRNLLYLFIISVTVPAFIHTGYSQDKFEGKVTFNVYDKGESHTLEYYVKGDKLRFDANEKGQEGQVIIDPSAKQFLIIMPQQKMYMVMQIPDMEANSEETGKTNENTHFVKTGDTKEILGYTAERWTYKNGNDEGEAWMTKEIGGFNLFDNPMMKNKPEWQKDIDLKGYFPLEVSENGKKVYEVTNIEKTSLDASMFEAPAGFQKMDMPTMQK